MSELSRRTTLKGAWTGAAGLVIVASATVPAYAASVSERIDPGLNGWLSINYGTQYGFDATFANDVTGNTPDGNPFGLYIPKPNRANGSNPFVTDKVTNALQILWLRGQTNSWATNPGHSSRWSRSYIGSTTQPDGLVYHGYRFAYNGAYAGTGGYSGSGFELKSDGRLWLESFDVTARDVQSGDATFWVERQVTIDIGKGAGPEVKSFKRRNGERGALGQGFPGGGNFRTTAGATDEWANVI